MEENSKSYDTGRQLGKLLRRGKESSDKTVAATKQVAKAVSTQSSVLMTFVKEVRDTAKNDAGDKAEALDAKRKADAKAANEANSEGGRFGKLINYFKKDAKESRTEFGKRLFGFFGKLALGIGALVFFFKNWDNAIKPFIKGFTDTLFPKLDETLRGLYKKIDERFTKIFGKSIGTTLKELKDNVISLYENTKEFFANIGQFFGVIQANENTTDREQNSSNQYSGPRSADEVFGEGVLDKKTSEEYKRFMRREGSVDEDKKNLAKDKKQDAIDKQELIFLNTVGRTLQSLKVPGFGNVDEKIEKIQRRLGGESNFSRGRRLRRNEFIEQYSEDLTQENYQNGITGQLARVITGGDHPLGNKNMLNKMSGGINFVNRVKFGAAMAQDMLLGTEYSAPMLDKQLNKRMNNPNNIQLGDSLEKSTLNKMLPGALSAKEQEIKLKELIRNRTREEKVFDKKPKDNGNVIGDLMDRVSSAVNGTNSGPSATIIDSSSRNTSNSIVKLSSGSMHDLDNEELIRHGVTPFILVG